MEKYLELFEELKVYVGKLNNSIENVYSTFRGEQYLEAFEIVPYIIDGIAWSVDAITLLKEYIDYEVDTVSFNNKLGELMDAFENKDNVLIGDIFEYEIYPIVLEWEKINFVSK